MNLSRIFYIAIIVSIAFQVCSAQTESTIGCKLFDKNLNAVSIRYAKSEPAKGKNTSDETVLLQLYNNTNCPIYIETENIVITATPQGRTTDIADEAVLKIGFLIQEKERDKEAKEFHKWTDNRRYSRLLGGRRVFFNVPTEIFRNKFFVIVPFFYEWDFPDDINSVKHQAYFYYGNIPSKVLNYQK
jgi:hypothetical protein